MNTHFPSENTAKNAVKVWSLAKAIHVAFLTVKAASSEEPATAAAGFDARPMRALFEENADAIWFIVPRAFPALRTVDALLTFSNGPDGNHVAFYGTTSRVDDPVKLKSLWTAHADIAFPKGSTDGDATLLKFEPAKASFWAGGSDTLSFVINFLEAKMTGEAPEVGKHGFVPQ